MVGQGLCPRKNRTTSHKKKKNPHHNTHHARAKAPPIVAPTNTRGVVALESRKTEVATPTESF